MQKLLFVGIVSTLVLASCGTQTTPTTSSTPTVPTVSYPTSQNDTPATRYCVKRGGTVSIEKDGTTGMDAAYCNLPEGGKIDAWKFMNDSTQLMGTGS